MLHRIILFAMLAVIAAPKNANAQISSAASFHIVTDTLEEEQSVELHLSILDQDIAAVQVEVSIQPEDKRLYNQTLLLNELDSENLESLSFDGAILKLNFGTHPIQSYQAEITFYTTNNTALSPITITSN